MQTVKVFAPASVANVGCGYDTMGFSLEAIGEEIRLTIRNDDRLVIKEVIGAELSKDPEQNVATIAIQSLLSALGAKTGFDVSITKKFKPGSGLGSSASSAAGAVFAANELLGHPYSRSELLPFALEGEAFASKSIHADNVAPSLLGGFQVIRSYEPLEVFEVKSVPSFSVLIIFPDVQIKTAESKNLLPRQVPLSVARNQWANTAALIHALHTHDDALLKRSIEDFVAEPVRKRFIPFYDEVREIMEEAGTVGFNISGSGPSMFALFRNTDHVEKAMDQVRALYNKSDFDYQSYRTHIDFKGCRIIE